MAQTTSLVFNGGVIPSPSPAPSGSGKAKLLKIGEITVTEQEVQVTKNVICDPDSVTTVAPFMEVLTSARLAELISANNILVLDDGTMQYMMSDSTIAVEDGTAVCTAVNFLGLSKENRAKVLYPCTRLIDELTLQQVIEVGEPVETGFDLVKAYPEDTEAGTLIDKLEIEDTIQEPEDQTLLEIVPTDGKVAINEDRLRETINGIDNTLDGIIETIDELDVDSVPHAYLHSTLNQSAGDSVTTGTQINVFALTADLVGDCFEFEQTTTIDATPFGYVWIEPGTYLINAAVTLQWVGNPRGTFIAKVGSVMGENFDFSQEQELMRQSTKVVTIPNRMKLSVNITYDAGTPAMGFWIQSMQVVKLAGGMSQTTVAHGLSIEGNGSVEDPLEISEHGLQETFDYAKNEDYFATKQEIATLATKSELQAERARATQRENEIETLFTLPTQEAVDAWLDAHPEATTTTVENNSITNEKLDDSIKFTRSATGNNRGYKVLVANGTATSQITDENTIYEIRTDFDLGGLTLNIPRNCTLYFNGGSLKNGTIRGMLDIVDCKYQIFDNITFVRYASQFHTDYIRPEWFGAKGNYSFNSWSGTDDSVAIQTAIEAANIVGVVKIKFSSCCYRVDSGVNLENGNILLEGCGSNVREDSYFPNTLSLSKYNQYTGTMIVNRGSSACFTLSSTATMPLQVRDIDFCSPVSSSTNCALKFSSDFNGPVWPLYIRNCHFRGFHKAIWLYSTGVQYNLAYVTISECAFWWNDYCVYCEDWDGATPLYHVNRNVVAHFKMYRTLMHQNTCIFRGACSGVAEFTYCNIEGLRSKFNDDSSAIDTYAFDVHLCRGATITIKWLTRESMAHKVFKIAYTENPTINIWTSAQSLGTPAGYDDIHLFDMGTEANKSAVRIADVKGKIVYHNVNQVYGNLIYLDSVENFQLDETEGNFANVCTNLEFYSFTTNNRNRTTATVLNSVEGSNYSWKDYKLYVKPNSVAPTTNDVSLGSSGTKTIIAVKAENVDFRNASSFTTGALILFNNGEADYKFIIPDPAYKYVCFLMFTSGALSGRFKTAVGFRTGTIECGWYDCTSSQPSNILDIAETPTSYNAVPKLKLLDSMDCKQGCSVIETTNHKLCIYDEGWKYTDGTSVN